MNYEELMQDFGMDLIETLKQKEEELSALYISAKEQLERFLISLKFYNNTVDVSNCDEDDIIYLIYHLDNLDDFEKMSLELQYQKLDFNCKNSNLQLTKCQKSILAIRLLLTTVEGMEESKGKMQYLKGTFNFITTNLKDIEFNIYSLLERVLNNDHREYDYFFDSMYYMTFLASVAKTARTEPIVIFNNIEEIKTYPEVSELIEDYKRRKVELELQQNDDEEPITLRLKKVQSNVI